MSAIGLLRRANIDLEVIDGTRIGATRAGRSITDGEIALITENKAAIIASLAAESFVGAPKWEDTALGAGLMITWRQTANSYDAAVAPDLCLSLIETIDALMEMPLAAALASYIQNFDAIAAQIKEINHQARLGLVGRELHETARQIFRPGAFNGNL